MIQAVLFDLDGTLYSFNDANAHAIGVVSERFEKETGFPRDQFDKENWRLYEKQCAQVGQQAGCHSRGVRFQMFCEEHGFPLRLAAPMTDLFWNSFLGAMKPFAGAAETFDAIRARGLKIGIGTNMTADWQLKKLAVLGLIDKIDFVVSSEESGADKPDSALFTLCAKKAGCAPSDCLFVGDSIEHDVKGAKAVSMRPVWICADAAKRAAHPDVESIGALPELLGFL